MSKTIKQIRRDLDSKKYSAEELTKEYLNKIKEKDDKIHAFLDVFKENAIKEAKRADNRIKEGKAGILTGIPCAIKDNILIEGRRCHFFRKNKFRRICNGINNRKFIFWSYKKSI